MTRIRYKSKPVWHETGQLDGITHRPYLVAESPAALLIRLKGTRTVLELPWSMAYLRAATLRATLDALNKINARRKRRHQVTRGGF